MDKLSSKKIISIGAIALVLILIINSCNSRGYKDTAIAFTKAWLDGNAKKMVSLMSDDYVDEFMEKSNESTKKTLINTLKKDLEGLQENFVSSYGKKWKYEMQYIDAIKDDDVCIVTLEVTIKGKKWFSGNKKESFSIDVELIKKGNKWYVDGTKNINA
jgi:hypothetical protein